MPDIEPKSRVRANCMNPVQLNSNVFLHKLFCFIIFILHFLSISTTCNIELNPSIDVIETLSTHGGTEMHFPYSTIHFQLSICQQSSQGLNKSNTYKTLFIRFQHSKLKPECITYDLTFHLYLLIFNKQDYD